MAEPRLISSEFVGLSEDSGGDHAHGLATLLDARFEIAHFAFRMPDHVEWSPRMYEMTGRVPGGLAL